MPNLNLDTLLNLLRTQGIAVGAAEHARLQQILSAQPDISGVAFRDLLGTVLGKNEEEQQRIAFVFEQFVRDLEVQIREQGAVDAELVKWGDADTPQPIGSALQEDEESTRTTHSRPKKPFNVLPWILGALALVTLILLVAFWEDQQDTSKDDTEVTVTQTDPTVDKRKQITPKEMPDKPLIKDVPVWSVEKITISDRPIAQEFLPPFLLFLGATTGFLWLLVKTLRQTRRRPPESIAYQEVTGYHTPAVKHAFYKLFNAKDRQALSWGVGHYFDQDQQQRIDIKRSVTASANEGYPVIAFEQSRFEREVWIWQDQQNRSELQGQMIREIKQALGQANIHVRHGYFFGTPYQITNQQGRLQYPVLGALPQPVPLVLLCLDAKHVAAHFRQSPHETAQIFQQLKQWSTLAVVDCNPSATGLMKTTQEYRIPYLLPAQVSDWFASQGAGKLRQRLCVLSDVYRWACACALAQRIVTEDEAYALHEAMGLNCAWQYSHLKRYGRATGAGLDFSNTLVERVNDLTVEDRECARHFWQQRFREIDQVFLPGRDYPNWKNSHSRYTDIKIPTALLALWEEPETAINALQDYAANDKNEDLKQAVRQHLSHYGCADFPAETVQDEAPFIQLPFSWHSLTPPLQQQLLSMGFAGYDKSLRFKPDRVSTVFMVGLAGLMCVALFHSVQVLMDKPPELTTRLNSASPPKAIAYNDEKGIFLGTANNQLYDVYEEEKDQKHSFSSLQNKRLEVNWLRRIEPAQQTIPSTADPEETAQLWRLGTRRTPLSRDIGTGTRMIASYALIKAKPDNAAAQSLAAELLDSGSADQVLIAEKPTSFQRRYRNWLRLSETQEAGQIQRIFIGEGIRNPRHGNDTLNTLVSAQSPAALLAAMRTATPGIQDKSALEQLGFKVEGDPFLRVLEQEVPVTGGVITLDNGIKLLPIPAGEFMMGSDNGRDSEKPVHKVTIRKPFWMGETEVTFDQYQAYWMSVTGVTFDQHQVYPNVTMMKLPNDQGWGRGSRPVINVNWQEAVAYTEWLTRTNAKGLNCRLPSEAEWEYAARAGTVTDYYWGDDDIAREYANFSGTGVADRWNRETAPVKQFKPNAFGLYDMSGNVWEWVQDKWHDNYEGAPEDGSAWESGASQNRVLRGGSWGAPFGNVHSASRDTYEFGFNLIGFRLVCSPIER